jgi:glycosyltransferase involved in cell wall biosynthesis
MPLTTTPTHHGSSPLISVIVPAYNSAKTVLETVHSVLNQSLQDLELIVIDDGSTDDTLSVLDSVTDPRLKVFSFENAGTPTSRNRGIERALGEFLSFIDADDLWAPDKLEKQLQALQGQPEAGVAYSWTLIMDAAGKKFYPGNCEVYEGDVHAHLLLSNFIASGSNILVRREAAESIGGFDPSLGSHEDWDYYLRLAQKWPFAVVGEPQIFYRKSSTSLCSNFEAMEKYIFIVHRKMFKDIPAHLMKLEAQSRAKKYEFLAQIALTHVSSWQNCGHAFRTLRQAIALYPPLLRTRRLQILLAKLAIALTLTPRLGDRALVFLLSLRAQQYMSQQKDPTSPQSTVQAATP